MPLTPVQKAMVDERVRNCCVISIPGSGKTSVITAKLAGLLRSGRSATAVTFTAEAGRELKERCAKLGLSRKELEQLETGTFHSLTLKRLRELQPEEMRRQVAKGGESRTMMARAIERNLGPGVAESFIDLMNDWMGMVDPLSTPDIWTVMELGMDKRQAVEATAATMNDYMALMREAGLIDFTEIMWRGLEVLRGWRDGRLYVDEESAPQRGDPAPIFSGGHVLVDEMQDIDEVQLEFMLLHHLALNATVDGVGDDDQSIYAFRKGLGVRGMRKFVAATDARMLTMDVNFRCRSEILAWAGSVIEQNKVREPKKLHAHRGEGGSVQLLEVKAGPPEIERIGMMVADDLKRSQKGTVAILCRVNRGLKDMEAELQKRGIDYRMIGVKSLWEEEPICLIVNALMEWRSVGLGRALRQLLYWCGCSEVDLRKLQQGMIERTLDSVSGKALDLSRKGQDAVEVIGEAWGALRKCDWRDELAGEEAVKNLAVAVAKMVEGTNVPSSESPHLVAAKVKVSGEMLGRIAGTPAQRAIWVKGMEMRARTSDARVKLVSMHSAKGLEFDSVYIMWATTKLLPGKSEGHLIDEERRVLYVAMTRAKDRLTITYKSKDGICPFLAPAGALVKAVNADDVLQVAQEAARELTRATTG